MLIFAVILAWLTALPQVSRADMAQVDSTVDVAIVLAIDASSSVDAQEYLLQMGGVAYAISDPSVQAVIAAGRNRAIALTVVTWSGARDQTVLLPWTRIDSAPAAKRVADSLLAAPRIYTIGGTAIGAALSYALLLFDQLPWATPRKVIDVSGDGRNNHPPLIRSLRPEVERRGVTINGLPVTNNDSGLARYYRDVVISGFGAFIVPTYSFETFPEAFRVKLMREIRGDPMVSLLP
ncbi:MAG: DUF1194 domain-containing protein [Minwuia sp.]|nr:DUF1194 domain-containing protein [Minwuia sp.]